MEKGDPIIKPGPYYKTGTLLENRDPVIKPGPYHKTGTLLEKGDRQGLDIVWYPKASPQGVTFLPFVIYGVMLTSAIPHLMGPFSFEKVSAPIFSRKSLGPILVENLIQNSLTELGTSQNLPVTYARGEGFFRKKKYFNSVSIQFLESVHSRGEIFTL